MIEKPGHDHRSCLKIAFFTFRILFVTWLLFSGFNIL
jgi:hypothetical protein